MDTKLKITCLILTLTVPTADTGNYDPRVDNREAVSPYKRLTGGDSFCRSECSKDPACNGYSTDRSNNSCFLSSCDTYLESSCWSCEFSRKSSPSSSVNCSQASDRPPSTAITSQVVTVTGNDVTNVTTYNVSCVCMCKDVNQTTEEAIERRRNELFLNKTKLSSAIRKLTSAEDFRMSSKVIGTVSVIILVLLGMLFFCADICSVLLFFFRKCLKIVHLSK